MVNLSLQIETINFLIFVVAGMFFSFIFDIFRAIRKINKPKKNIIDIQDIIYFIIIGMLLIYLIVNMQGEVLRLYLILAIILGIILYTLIAKNKIRDIFVILINKMSGIIQFIFLPLKIHYMFLCKVCKKIKKCVKVSCKRKSDMIEFYHKKVKNVRAKTSIFRKQKKEES